jgi:putative transposase
VPAYETFASADLLGADGAGADAGKLSTRRYGLGLEPVGEQTDKSAKGTSKSANLRRFVAGTAKALAELMSADLSQLDLAVIMIDGMLLWERERVLGAVDANQERDHAAVLGEVCLSS